MATAICRRGRSGNFANALKVNGEPPKYRGSATITKNLMYLNQAGSSLIAFGNELNLIKADLAHGKFGQWIGANIPVKISQCQKYMAIAKSNTHSNGYLNIDSEVLLLAFEPEIREVAREELKDNNQAVQTPCLNTENRPV